MANELATVDPISTEITFERPVRVITQHYGVSMKSDTSSKAFAVTADHRMLVRRWNRSTEPWSMTSCGSGT